MILLLFSFVVAGVFVLFQFNREKEFKVELLDSELQMLNRDILTEISGGDTPKDAVSRLARENDAVRVTVIDSLGNVLYDSFSRRPDTLSNHLKRDEVFNALINGKARTVQRISESNGVAFFYSAMFRDGIVVRSSIPYGVSLSEFLQIDRSFIWVMVIVLMVMAVISYVISRFVSKAVMDTGEREKLDIRKELTNNINHELKTPVSAIRAYLETILSVEDLPDEQVRDFVAKCYAQTQRLNSLLQDLSTITRLEEASHLYKHEPIVINDIIEELRAYLDVLPEEKRMRLHTNITSAIVVVGDPMLMNSIFRNLLENAIAYSGGTDIYINVLSMDKSEVQISFADNGVGVDEQHLDLLFQRFYRVDKGRSRKIGGTGLGLSIVKNAVMYHKGKIIARIRKGGGLEFVFTLTRN